MPSSITFDETENRYLQETILEMYQNYNIRSVEGPLFLAILNKLETWPAAPTFTSQENRRLQVLVEQNFESVGTYPSQCSIAQFGSKQLRVIRSILAKLEAQVL